MTFGGGNKIEYIYTGSGTRVGKRVIENGSSVQTDYLGGFQYKGSVLQFFPTAGGYVDATGGQYSYVFHYTDHLGNVRLSYTRESTGAVKILEESHYYPFGMKHSNYNDAVHDLVMNPDGSNYAVVAQVAQGKYRYRFNGQEWQDELGLNMTAMDYRPYDNSLGRFHSVDALAETQYSYTPYHFGFNNPVYWNDPSGLHPASMMEIIKAAWNATADGTNSHWINDGSNNFDNANGSSFISRYGEYVITPSFNLEEVTFIYGSGNW